MVGGPNSFGSGRWNDTTVGNMLPVELNSAGGDWEESIATVDPVTDGAIHPIWRISTDDVQNRALLKASLAFGAIIGSGGSSLRPTFWPEPQRPTPRAA